MSGANTDAFAPAKFHGDWSALDRQGYLSMDFKLISACCPISEGIQFWIARVSRRLATSS